MALDGLAIIRWRSRPGCRGSVTIGLLRANLRHLARAEHLTIDFSSAPQPVEDLEFEILKP
ncbi:hypothetical protein ASF64_17195 [Arthrobacter sp. Leaf137]|nr:hypothetical protein ASF64_17195 [Arthrobacter sp. Leaf137]